MPDWELLKANVGLAALALTKIPMIAFAGPRFMELSSTKAVIRIPLGYRTRNHLGSMYFGAMAVGADLVIGGLAWSLINKSGKPLNLIFKDFKAEYLKRAEDDVLFICEEGTAIRALIDRVIEAGERVNGTVSAYALVPKKFGAEPVATFQLTLSLK
jgi:acyl-coenzyme A thioesterase PaaI-like protein